MHPALRMYQALQWKKLLNRLLSVFVFVLLI